MVPFRSQPSVGFDILSVSLITGLHALHYSVFVETLVVCGTPVLCHRSHDLYVF